jgi:hypothetical protein
VSLSHSQLQLERPVRGTVTARNARATVPYSIKVRNTGTAMQQAAVMHQLELTLRSYIDAELAQQPDL